MATKLSVEFKADDVIEIEARMLQPGDFFERNGSPYVFVKRTNRFFDDACGEVVRIGSKDGIKIGTFQINLSDKVHVYKSINVQFERI